MSCHLNNAPSSNLQFRCKRSFFGFIYPLEGTCSMAQVVNPSAGDLVRVSHLASGSARVESAGA
jgi:hypothetical protein